MEAVKVGKIKVHILEDGFFRLDVGACCGAVPKKLWGKSDLVWYDYQEEGGSGNTVELASRGFLIEQPSGDLILVDTGFGLSIPEVVVDHMYILRPQGSLFDALSRLGVNCEDILLVINTHLHLDHAGGNTLSKGGEFVPAFPRAAYFVQRKEWEAARRAVRDPDGYVAKAAYFGDHFLPLKKEDKVILLPKGKDVTSLVSCFPTPGHTLGHQSVLIETEGAVAIILGAVGITAVHLENPRWIAALDLNRQKSYETKMAVIKMVLKKRALLLFAHDPERPFGYLEKTNRSDKFRVVS